MKKPLKNLVDSTNMSKTICKPEKQVETKPSTVHGLCKVHIQEVSDCPQFMAILMVLQTLRCSLVKFSVSALNPLIKNEYAAKTSFNFHEEICEQEQASTMDSLDVDSLFTKIPLDETIDIRVD